MISRLDIIGTSVEKLGGVTKRKEITVWTRKRTVEYVEIADPPGHDSPVIVLIENRPANANDEAFLHDMMLERMQVNRANPGKDVLIYLLVGPKLISELEKRAGEAYFVQSILGLRFGLFITYGSKVSYTEHGHGPAYHIERGGKTDFGYWDRVDVLSDRISGLVVDTLNSGDT